jgi:hypothetical protein
MMMFMAACALSVAMWSQKVFTVVYATSDDGFVSVRERPTVKAREIGKIWMLSHGVGSGVLVDGSGKWWKVSDGKVTGWSNSRYLGTQTWVDGTGAAQLVAARPLTTIYRENYEDGSKPQKFGTVAKGTIIADHFEVEGIYYLLKTAHDNLYIKKTDVKVVRKR